MQITALMYMHIPAGGVVVSKPDSYDMIMYVDYNSHVYADWSGWCGCLKARLI